MSIGYEVIDGKVVKKVTRKKLKTPRERAKEEILSQAETFTEGQWEAFNAIIDENSGNVFLTGEAGSGKSYVTKLAIKYLREVEHKKVAVTASTATAARLIDAVTTHGFFSFKPEMLVDEKGHPVAHATSKVASADVIFVDECSMVRIDCFLSIVASLKKCAKKRAKAGLPPQRLILVGDMAQLPPVLTPKDKKDLKERLGYDVGEGFAFNSDEWEECNFRSIVLKEVMRQKGESEFLFHLNKIRLGDGSWTHWFNKNCTLGYNPDAISIFPYNHMVREENARKLAEIPGAEEVFEASLVGGTTKAEVEANGLDFELKLKSDCTVMLKCNPYAGCEWVDVIGTDPEHYIDYFCNGSLAIYRASGVDEDGREYLWLELKENGRLVKLYQKYYPIYDYAEVNGKLKKYETGDGFYAYPIVLGYALTCHKAQGASLSAINLYPTKAFASGMLYVGLSRVKGGAKNIYLQEMVRPEDAILSAEVKEFYEELEKEKG